MGCFNSKSIQVSPINERTGPSVIHIEEPLKTRIMLSTDKYINFLIDLKEVERGSFDISHPDSPANLEMYVNFVDNLENPKLNVLESDNIGSMLFINENK